MYGVLSTPTQTQSCVKNYQLIRHIRHQTSDTSAASELEADLNSWTKLDVWSSLHSHPDPVMYQKSDQNSIFSDYYLNQGQIPP